MTRGLPLDLRTFSCESLKVKSLSLNIDLGELPDEPDELYSIATMVNIACGGHAGDAVSMRRAVDLALTAGAKIAAHPSYPDRENFGRKSMVITITKLALSLRWQISRLQMIAAFMGGSVFAVKPHGALYHDVAELGVAAEILITVLESLPGTKLVVVGPPNCILREKALERGFTYLDEGFADRMYFADGQLVPRSEPNALLTDPVEAAAQALRLAHTQQFDTLCVHADTPNALSVARAVRTALIDAQLLDRG